MVSKLAFQCSNELAQLQTYYSTHMLCLWLTKHAVKCIESHNQNNRYSTRLANTELYRVLPYVLLTVCWRYNISSWSLIISGSISYVNMVKVIQQTQHFWYSHQSNGRLCIYQSGTDISRRVLQVLRWLDSEDGLDFTVILKRIYSLGIFPGSAGEFVILKYNSIINTIRYALGLYTSFPKEFLQKLFQHYHNNMNNNN